MLKKNYLLDKYLPKDDGTSFFISSPSVEHITALLESGLRFTEKNYEYKGQNLFMNIVSKGREYLIKPIIPYLSFIDPINGSIDEQTKIIDELKFSKELKDFIKEHYTKLLMKRISDKLNEVSPENNNTVKVKI